MNPSLEKKRKESSDEVDHHSSHDVGGKDEVDHHSRLNMVLSLLLGPPLFLVVCHPMLVILSIIVSSIRLHQGDYGDGPWNLRPAAVIFYSLAVAQSVLYLIWLVLNILLEHPIAEYVSSRCGFNRSWGQNCVLRYLTETRSMCLKDLSATRERNLITHASDLLNSYHSEDYISGARMLDTFIANRQLQQIALIRSSRERIQKLILILAWRDESDMEIRRLAANIVGNIASDISLAQFPGALNCLCFLLRVSEGHSIFNPPKGTATDAEKNKAAESFELLKRGFDILENLCKDELNCIEICDSRILVRHILAWAFSRPVLKQQEKEEWVTIVTSSFNILARLASIRGHFSEMARKDIVFELFPSCLPRYEDHPKVLSKAIYTFSHAFRMKVFPDPEIGKKRDDLVAALLKLFSIKKIEVKPGVSDPLKEAREEAGKALLRLSIFKDNCVAIIRIKQNIFDELSAIIGNPDIAVHHKAIAADILMRLINQCSKIKPDEEVTDQGTESQAGKMKKPEKEQETGEVLLKAARNNISEMLPTVLKHLSNSINGNGEAGTSSTEPQSGPTYNFPDNERFDSKKLQANLLRIISIMLPRIKNTQTLLNCVKTLVQGNNTDAEANQLEILKMAAMLATQMTKRGIAPASEKTLMEIIDSLFRASDALSDFDSCMFYLGTHYSKTVLATTLSDLLDGLKTYKTSKTQAPEGQLETKNYEE